MKLKSDCIPCLVERTKYKCDILFEDDRENIPVLSVFIAFLFEHLEGERNAPVFFGTERERLLKRRSGAEDPHELVKGYLYSDEIFRRDFLRTLNEKLISSSEAGCKIIPSGTYIGVSLEEAKLERNGRLIYLFRAKCEPIANDIGVRRGELVAKFV